MKIAEETNMLLIMSGADPFKENVGHRLNGPVSAFGLGQFVSQFRVDREEGLNPSEYLFGFTLQLIVINFILFFVIIILASYTWLISPNRTRESW